MALELPPHVAHILDAARAAPSRDNLQPWRFFVEGETISFAVDPERDRSPMNASGRMARVAVGAAIEQALIRAGRMGATVRFPPPRPSALVTITVTDPKRVPEPDKAVARRVTNRRTYDARPVDDATFAWLREATPATDSVKTHWFGRERVRVLGPIVEEAEALFFANAASRAAALAAMRFDARDRDDVTHGLSIGSLELSGPERVTFDELRRVPQERLAAMGAFKKMGARGRRLIESASGVCILTAHGSEPLTDVTVGRCLERAWLSITRKGMVAQPLSTIPSLEAMLDVDDGTLDATESDRVATLVTSLRGAFPSVERGARIAIALRFGFAAPTTRVGRRPLEECVELVRPAAAPEKTEP